MRKLAFALAIGLLASAGGFGTAVQSVAAASGAKVVIVVGATQGDTAKYRSDGDAAAATFSQYTSNIVKVYSPNATWAAVQAAAQGASVLVYLGHGSGYPNPYNSQPVAGDNGMGLNTPTGGSDNTTQYYGSGYMAQLNLATNAVVLLNHLCYASGNSEPGQGTPTLSVAQTRVDGYASGFLSGNARAVIAEGTSSISPYIDAIFSTHQTIDQMWKSAPSFHNNVTSWASTRNAGYTSQIDPSGTSYYRSMVSLPGLTTDDVGLVGTYPPTTYVPITPARLLDTRAGNGLSGKLVANAPRTFQVRGRGGVPESAMAVTGNVTVVSPTASWAVYLGGVPTAYPATSTINFSAGAIVSNSVTVGLGSGGTLSATYMSFAGNTTDLVFDVTGYYTADMTGATYHPMTPARLLDSRSGNGLSGKLVANTPRTFVVSGRGGIPAGATAVTGNVTVVNPSYSWAVYLGPVATASPTTSTINFSAGEIRANGLTVALRSDGTLSATFMSFAGNTTDLVFDVTGYYTADATGTRYVPMAPSRLLDSRVGNGLSGKLIANTPATFQVTGRGGIPSNATAVTGNVTVVNQTYSWAVFLGPVATASPTTSTINFNTGDIVANGLTVALGSGGTLSATYISQAGNTTDLVFDVTGYFVP
jgi:hypothetical protein